MRHHVMAGPQGLSLKVWPNSFGTTGVHRLNNLNKGNRTAQLSNTTDAPSCRFKLVKKSSALSVITTRSSFFSFNIHLSFSSICSHEFHLLPDHSPSRHVKAIWFPVSGSTSHILHTGSNQGSNRCFHTPILPLLVRQCV